MDLGAAARAQFGQARVGGVEADHVLEVRDRDEQRAVGVAFAQHRVDLEHRAGRVLRVDAHAVVDDALEHRERADPHATMFS